MKTIMTKWYSVNDLMPGDKVPEVTVRYILVDDPECDLFGMAHYMHDSGKWDMCFDNSIVDYRSDDLSEGQRKVKVTHWCIFPQVKNELVTE